MYVIKLYNNKNFYVNYRWPRRKKFPIQVNCIGNYSIYETYGNLVFRPDIMKHCERQYSSLYLENFCQVYECFKGEKNDSYAS